MRKKLTVLTLAFAMVLTMSASVFAVEKTAAPVDKQAGPGAAALVKYLKIEEGVSTPNATFTFTFTPVPGQEITVDNKTHTTAAADKFPKIDGSTTFTKTISTSQMDTARISGTNDLKGTLTVSQIFGTNIPESAGEYIYEVSESQSGLVEDSDTTTTEIMSYDNQKYKLHIYVTNKTDGTGTEISNVTVENEDQQKVDPDDTDPTPGNGETRDASYKADGFTFTNNYEKQVTKHTDPDNPDGPVADGAFALKKIVKGDFGDKKKEFDFTVKVDYPATSATQTKTVGSYTFADNAEVTVSLADAHDLTFDALPMGTKVTVSETGYQNYKATYNGYETGADGAKAALDGNTAVPTEPQTGDTAIAQGMAAKTLRVGEKGAGIDVTNYYCDDNVTPTGIIINNLPYVLLIAIALGGIVLFSRKRRYE